jgi:hypothetical protein
MSTELSDAAVEAGLLTIGDIAAIVGISQASARTYHTDANRRRRANASLPQDMPPPDLIIVRTPVWRPETIADWRERRQVAAAANIARLKEPRGPRTPVE